MKKPKLTPANVKAFCESDIEVVYDTQKVSIIISEESCPTGKVPYKTYKSALSALKKRNKDKGAEVYKCDVCGSYHLGRAFGETTKRRTPNLRGEFYADDEFEAEINIRIKTKKRKINGQRSKIRNRTMARSHC